MCTINKTPEIHFCQATTPTPEQFVAGLTDLGTDRSKMFPKSADESIEARNRLALKEAASEIELPPTNNAERSYQE